MILSKISREKVDQLLLVGCIFSLFLGRDHWFMLKSEMTFAGFDSGRANSKFYTY